MLGSPRPRSPIRISSTRPSSAPSSRAEELARGAAIAADPSAAADEGTSDPGGVGDVVDEDALAGAVVGSLRSLRRGARRESAPPRPRLPGRPRPVRRTVRTDHCRQMPSSSRTNRWGQWSVQRPSPVHRSWADRYGAAHPPPRAPLTSGETSLGRHRRGREVPTGDDQGRTRRAARRSRWKGRAHWRHVPGRPARCRPSKALCEPRSGRV